MGKTVFCNPGVYNSNRNEIIFFECGIDDRYKIFYRDDSRVVKMKSTKIESLFRRLQ